jgi:hypothetical protein
MTITNSRVSRSIATQAQKQITFARAYQTIKAHQQRGDLLSAYVVGFSIFEDRLRAMFVVRYRKQQHGEEPSIKQIMQGINRIIGYLSSHNDINSEAKERFKQATKERNHVIHAAMWNLHATTLETIDSIIRLGRQAESFRRKQRAVLKQ